FDLRAEFLPAAAGARFSEGGHLAGKVQAAGSPIAGSAVTLYAAGEGAPVSLAPGESGADGTLKLDVGADKLQESADKVHFPGGPRWPAQGRRGQGPQRRHRAAGGPWFRASQDSNG